MKIFAKGSLAAGALALTLGTGFFAGQAMAVQTHMQNALSALQTARSQLQAANADKGGHRAKAIGLVNDAISQVNAGIVAGRK
ncbi:MAG TPA: hypothetical protein VH000_13760 [Rhizomicrobium sp.]|jgi:hypothetical protein|nr:hypothetical protein [Rhizomicrobium sp.]